MESGDAVTQALLGLPLPADAAEDAAHHAAMLRMLGSLKDVRRAVVGGEGMALGWLSRTALCCQVPSCAWCSTHVPGPHLRAEMTCSNFTRPPNWPCSQRRAGEIAALTDIDSRTAAAIVAFFQRGGRAAGGVPGLPPFGAAQLQSL